jgi:hypothetical protein
MNEVGLYMKGEQQFLIWLFLWEISYNPFLPIRSW